MLIIWGSDTDWLARIKFDAPPPDPDPVQAPFEQVLTQLSITVIAPLFVGQVTQYLAPKAVAWLQV